MQLCVKFNAQNLGEKINEKPSWKWLKTCYKTIGNINIAFCSCLPIIYKFDSFSPWMIRRVAISARLMNIHSFSKDFMTGKEGSKLKHQFCDPQPYHPIFVQC